ncbi:MAG: hypothetical protein JWN48_3923 [Myxococcaceae bacterium]|nr:hypothetical protein [Myxococcaceae bacterium]
MRQSGSQQKPCEIILCAAERSPRRLAIVAAVAAALLHVGGAVALALQSSSERPPIKKSQPLVVIDHVIDLDPPKLAQPAPPPAAPAAPARDVEKAPPPAPRSKPKPAPVADKPAAQSEVERVAPPEAPEPAKAPSEPPPAAQAGQVVAAAAGAQAPAAFGIATGAGPSFAGGATTAQGTGTKANHTGQVGVGDGNGLSKARPPQLHSRSWPCGWPSEAEDLDADEVLVTVRASIGADGSVQDIEVIDDPGNGFGKRASLCARTKVRFDPALDASGQPVAGRTPPLHIKFVRDGE